MIVNCTEPNMTSPILYLRAALVMAVVAMGGCASQFPPAPATLAATNYLYRIGPGDVLNVVVFRNPDLSMTVPVRPDGRISAPLIPDVEAVGKDPATLAREIEKALSHYVREPVVSVIVTNFVGPYSEQIRVVGEAAKPQVLAYRQSMTLLDVLIAVGGVTEFADGNAATIMRAADGNKQYGVRVRDLLKRGDMSANVEMRPGDVVIIPQSWF